MRTTKSTRLKRFRERAWNDQGGACFYCCWTIKLPEAVAEHFIPRVAGGKTNSRNIVASCNCCNQRKMEMSAADFLASPGYMQILVGRGLFVPFNRTRGWRQRHRQLRQQDYTEEKRNPRLHYRGEGRVEYLIFFTGENA